MTAPYFKTRNHVAVKLEVTEGTDSVPADADVIHPAYDPEYTPTDEQDERNNVQSSFSNDKQISGELSGQITFGTELKGSGVVGTVPPNLAALFRSCGFAETIDPGVSVTYDPATEGLESATVELREGSTGTKAKSKKLVGARGNLAIEAVKGDIVMVRVTYTGRYIEPDDSAVVMFVTPAVGPDPLSFLSAGISLHGIGTLKMQNVSIDMANKIVLRNDANQATGNFSALMTGRKPTATMDPEQEDEATINYYNKMTTNVEGVLTYALTGVAGNIVTLTAPKAQITGISESDRDDIRTAELTLMLNKDTAAGDDEISIVFT